MIDEIATPAAVEEPAAPAQPANPAAAPPAAAQVVLNGEKTERETQLERDLEAERQARKKVECDNAQLQDELHRISAPPTQTTPRRGPLGIRAS